MKQKTVRILTNYLNETQIVEPNDLGYPFLTIPYRRITQFFKTAPFLIIVPIALLSSTAIVYLFGLLAIRLVSLLQYGF